MRLIRLDPPKPSGGLVVFSHGTGNDAFYPHLSLFGSLLHEGFSVLSYDLDGHGQEGSTLLHKHTVTACLPDVLGQLTPSDRPVHLVGHSLGGSLTAFCLAGLKEAGICSAALISAPVSLNPGLKALARELQSFFTRSTLRQLAVYGFRDIWPAIGPFGRNEFPVRLKDPSEGDYISQVVGIVQDLRLLEMAPQISVPVLLCYGGKDAIVPPEQGRLLTEVLPHPEFHILPYETHFSCLLAEKTGELVVDWIRRQQRSTVFS